MPNTRNANKRGRATRGSSSAQPEPINETFYVDDRERELYESLKERDVTRSSVVGWAHMLERAAMNDPVADRFVEYVHAMHLDRLAPIDAPISKQLLMEFYLTFRWQADGEAFTLRLNGDRKTVDNDTCMMLFGFPCQKRHTPDNERGNYNEAAFWSSIRTNAEWDSRHKAALTFVESNPLYMAYRYFACAVLDKSDPSRMNAHELYLMWCIVNNRERVEIFPHIWEVIRRRQTTTALKRPNPLGLGVFITILARHFQWVAPAYDMLTPTLPLVFNTQLLHVRESAEPWTVFVMSPDRTRVPDTERPHIRVHRGQRAAPQEPNVEERAEAPHVQEGLYLPGVGEGPWDNPDFGTGLNMPFGEGSSSRPRGHTIEDVWDSMENSRIFVRDQIAGLHEAQTQTGKLIKGYRNDVVNYRADLDKYQDDILEYKAAVESQTLATRTHQLAVDANTVAYNGYRVAVEAQADAQDEMFRSIMERLNLGGHPPMG